MPLKLSQNATKTKSLFFSLLLLILVLFPIAVSGLILQENYPQVVGVNITPSTTLHELAIYVYYFFIIIGGLVAFWGLFMGGFQWLTSGGSPGRVSEAKSQVLASFSGIIILLSSWVILYTLDPSLVTFHAFPASVEPAPAEPTSMAATQLEDGLLFYTTNSDVPVIPMPKGALQPVEDTERFPWGGTTLHLGGPPAGSVDYLQRIEFLNPIDEMTCDRDPDGNIIAGTCDLAFYYGLICFSETHFQGLARVITSYNATEHSLFGLFADQGLPNQPCRSLYVFKQPAINIYDRGDQILFYEQDFPIDKDPDTQAVIGGACIKINTKEGPHDCNVFHRNILQQDYSSVNGVFKFDRLEGKTDDVNGAPAHRWGGNTGNPGPLSMEITVNRDRKYLVLLYQDKDFKGDAYKIDRTVPDFSDPKDIRLYWVRSGSGNAWPRSAQILPIEPIE